MLSLFSFLEEKFDRKHISLKKTFIVLREVLKTIFNIFWIKRSLLNKKSLQWEIGFHFFFEKKSFEKYHFFLGKPENLGDEFEISNKFILAKGTC